MRLRLPLRFWFSLGAFALLVAVIVEGPRFFIETSEVLTFSDEISVGAAHADPVLPDSGLTLATERRIEMFMQELRAQPRQPERWSRLNHEWLEYARQWFERVYPGQEKFNRYASLWVGKREKSKLWRLNCRNEFFPDMSDKELVSKAEWLKEQEEWQEMQEKITRGLATVEAEYEQALHGLLGEHWGEFQKLHSLFLRDQLPKTGGETKFFL